VRNFIPLVIVLMVIVPACSTLRRDGGEKYADHLFGNIPGAHDTSYSQTVQEGRVVLTNEVESYLYRNERLKFLSPLELGMLYSVSRTPRMKFPLGPEHKLYLTHCHVARRRHHYPQFLLNLPKRPAEDASREDKNAYGAFVLSLFTAWTPTDFFSTELNVVGMQPWEKYLTWRRVLPRDLLDRRAVEMLDNATLQATARAHKDRNPKVSLSFL